MSFLASLPLLSLSIFTPVLGVIAILAFPRANAARWIALVITIITFIFTLMVWAAFDPSNPGFQLEEQVRWLGSGISYHVGVDGISMLFLVLTGGVLPVCVAASWKSIQTRVAEYMIAFLLLETLMMGVFCALDLVLFYVMFEGSLTPMFLIIGIWGHERRVYASFKFFLYTFLGSILMLLAIMAMYWYTGTTDIEVMLNTAHFPVHAQTWLFLGFFTSFAVKLPMWPIHTWLPDAHVEAPTAGSVILASVLLKLGGYGFLRISLPMFPSAVEMFAPMIFTMSVVAIIYASLVALAQDNWKKLVAYSSVAHMGFVTMGMFTLTHQGIDGSIFQMLSHGVVSGALFLCVGVMYDRLHTHEISAYGGLVSRMPVYALCFMVFTMANIGLPGTSGFVGEFLTMLGAFLHNSWIAIFATTGVIWSACYALYLYRRIVFGALVKPTLQAVRDLSWRETAILAPLMVLTIAMGVYPKPVLDVTGAAVTKLISENRVALAYDQAPKVADNHVILARTGAEQ
jgi:NADH-quinone oxidoreductase subunit M